MKLGGKHKRRKLSSSPEKQIKRHYPPWTAGLGAGSLVPSQLFFNVLTTAGQMLGKIKGQPLPHPSSSCDLEVRVKID